MAKMIPGSPQGHASDPFRERAIHPFKRRIAILGQLFCFESNSCRLLKLVDAAYCGLPAHRLGQQSKRIYVRLHLTGATDRGSGPFPPDMRMHGARGLLCGAMNAQNYAVLSPPARTGLVVASRDLLEYPYEARYELIEFAVFTLACRSQGLIPLHAACIGLNGRGLLLIGASGAGKSTLATLCASSGMDFLTEDATFVAPDSMLGTGVTNYLHVRKDSLRYIDDRRTKSLIRKSPLITRRSGVKKYEVDLRTTSFSLARAPLKISGIVFVTARPARGPLLVPLRSSQSIARMLASQSYGAAQPGWPMFARRVRKLPAYELRRGHHPREAVEMLRNLAALS
jgi:hypothetical protein